MAELKINISGIASNIKTISKFLEKHHIQWSLITKVFSGDMEFLQKVLTSDVVKKLHSIGDSRLISLKNIKKVNPNIRTIFIKPPAKIFANDIVQYADVSLNTSIATLKALDQAAQKQSKIHKVIIMIELGELREGVLGNRIIEFYQTVFNLKNIETIGIGANLGCMYGVEPTYDKLMQLTLYGRLIESTFNKKLTLFSGGSSITLPLVADGDVPSDINHFRIGESVFFGTSPLRNKQFLELNTDNFRLSANLIEIEEKRIIPQGKISEANIGNIKPYDDSRKEKRAYKAIFDFGMLDVDANDLTPLNKNLKLIGTTSDMTVYEYTDNEKSDEFYQELVGEKFDFKLTYMAVARLLNSKFIGKHFL